MAPDYPTATETLAFGCNFFALVVASAAERDSAAVIGHLVMVDGRLGPQEFGNFSCYRRIVEKGQMPFNETKHTESLGDTYS